MAKPRDMKTWSDCIHPSQTIDVIKFGRSFLFLEDGLESDAFEAIERSRTAFDLHTENCALPRSQQEFGELHRIER
jgi:hypothetical protein